MKKLFFLTLFFLLSSLLSAQNISKTVRGVVVDKFNRMPLIGATVVVLETTPPIGVVCDLNGNFVLENIPVGRVSLQISYLGYKSATLNNLPLTSGRELVLTVELEENVITTKEFVVTADREKEQPINKMTTVSARMFSVEETKRYAGSMNDVARMSQNFAGVQGGNDNRNDIIVRGNSPTGVLYRLEGVDIPSPNHFTSIGITGGPVSILNNNVLSNSDFMTGAFPAEYGNALAGVFDLKMRNGNTGKREFVGQFGFNGAELMAEGPFVKGKRASYLASYRYSTLEFFKLAGISFGTKAVPEYQDFSFKFNFPYKNGSLSFFGLGGMSYIELLASEIDSSNKAYGTTYNDIYFGSKVGAAGISHTHILNQSTYIRTVLSLNGMSNLVKNDSLNTIDRSDLIPKYRNNSYQIKRSANVFLNKKISSKHLVKTGFILDWFKLKLSDSTYVARINQFITLSDFEGESSLLQPYMQYQYRPSNQITINVGLHYQHFFLNGSQALEPRAGIKWQLNDIQTLSLGYGLHSQIQPITVYFEEELDSNGDYVTPNKQIGFTKSHHFVLGYDRLISEQVRLKTELYYQSLFDVPVDVYSNAYSMLNQGADFGIPVPDSVVNEGTGKNYGIELTLERFFDKGLYYLLTTSLFESKYKGSDGVERHTVFSNGYVLNALAGKEITLKSKKENPKRVNQVFFDGKLSWKAGLRYTPIDLEASRLRGGQVYDFDNVNLNKYPDYWRLDVKIGYRILAKKVTQEMMIYLQNTTNRKNIFQEVYNPETKEIETTYQLGLLPVFQYRIEF